MQTVDVLLSGSILPGTDLATAAAQLAKQAGIDQDRAAALISSGTSRVVKRGVSAEIGQAYLDKLTAMGIGASLRPLAAPQPAAVPPADAAPAQPVSAAPAPPAAATGSQPGPTTGPVASTSGSATAPVVAVAETPAKPINPYSAPTADLSPDTRFHEAIWRDTANRVPASHGVLWIRQAWALFTGRPGVWIGATLLMQLLFFIVNLLFSWTGPGANVILGILNLFFAAGAVLMAHRQIEGEPMGVLGIFTCFRQDTLQILLLAGINVLYWCILGVLVYLIIGPALIGTLAAADPQAMPTLLMAHGLRILLALVLAALLAFLLMLGMISAPTLVVLTGENAPSAIYKSLLAGLKNWLALLVNGTAILLAGMGMGIVFGLLFGLAPLLPKIITPFLILLGILALVLVAVPLFVSITWIMPYLISRDFFYDAS